MKPALVRAIPAVMLLLAASSLLAQSDTSCRGKLRVNSIYSDIRSSGSQSTVTYHINVQNAANGTLTASLLFRGFPQNVRLASLPALRMARNETKDVVFATLQISTASAREAPTYNPGNVSVVSAGELPRAGMPTIYMQPCIVTSK